VGLSGRLAVRRPEFAGPREVVCGRRPTLAMRPRKEWSDCAQAESDDPAGANSHHPREGWHPLRELARGRSPFRGATGLIPTSPEGRGGTSAKA
jgi:hypothetical protein